jgi:hypothetical protein
LIATVLHGSWQGKGSRKRRTAVRGSGAKSKARPKRPASPKTGAVRPESSPTLAHAAPMASSTASSFVVVRDASFVPAAGSCAVHIHICNLPAARVGDPPCHMAVLTMSSSSVATLLVRHPPAALQTDELELGIHDDRKVYVRWPNVVPFSCTDLDHLLNHWLDEELN